MNVVLVCSKELSLDNFEREVDVTLVSDKPSLTTRNHQNTAGAVFVIAAPRLNMIFQG